MLLQHHLNKYRRCIGLPLVGLIGLRIADNIMVMNHFITYSLVPIRGLISQYL